jgi:cell division protein FtsB
MRVLLFVLAAAFVLLQYRLWISEEGWREVWALDRSIEMQQQENQQLQERNQRLEAEVGDLKKGTEAAEEIARSDLGMIGQGETLYQIAAPDDGGDEEAGR